MPTESAWRSIEDKALFRLQHTLNMAKGKKIRVLIGDAQPIFRDGLKRLLSQEPDISVIGEADNGKEVMKMVDALNPELLIQDLLLPGLSGLEVLEQLQPKRKKPRVILLTSSEKEEDFVLAMKLGTSGIVMKQAPVDILIKCIRKVEAGEIWLDTRMTGAVMKEFSGPGTSNRRERGASPLSARETQVVGLTSQGFKNKEIAQRMFISEQTVKNHLHNIFDKLGVSDRLELALYVIHKNLQVPQ